MGQHHSSHSGERRLKEYGGAHHAGPRMEGQPINIDKTGRTTILKTHALEEDHEPLFCKNTLKSPDAKDEPMRYRPSGNRKMLPCVIKWAGGGQNVCLAGTFNDWQKLPMVKSEKDFVAIVDLPEGDFEYKFEVDGEWRINPNDEKMTNPEGIQNNIISISESDIEELENELLKDPNDINAPEPFSVSHSHHHRYTGDDDEAGYSQVMPEFKPTEKVRDPPVLPPHLLQVILNKDTPVSCEPTLLPEPNHVIVNHMYALSIRDGMMVLSTTHRYKKKSVTTLIYRPI